MKLAHFYFLFAILFPALFLEADVGTFQQVPRSPFPTGQAPSNVAYSPMVSGLVISAVTNEGDNNVSVYFADNNTGVFTQVPGSPFATGTTPISVAFSPQFVVGNYLAAVVNFTSNNLSVYNVNPTTGFFDPVTGSPFLTGTTPVSVAFSPIISDNLFVAVVNFNDNTVETYAVDPGSGVLLPPQIFAAGTAPSSVAFSSVLNGNTAFVAVTNFGDASISIYRMDPTGSLSPAQTFPTGNNPNGVAFSPVINGKLYAAVTSMVDNTVSLYLVDQTTGALTQVSGSPFSTGSAPFGVAFSPLANGILLLAVPNGGDNTISVYLVDATTDSLTPVDGSPFASGVAPEGIAFSPLISGKLFAAANNMGDNTVSVYQVAFIEPPANLRGFQVRNKFFNRTEYVNVLEWSAPGIGATPVVYKIFRNNLNNLIKVVKADKPRLRFENHDRKKCKTTTYFIESVDASGNVSAPASVQVKGICK